MDLINIDKDIRIDFLPNCITMQKCSLNKNGKLTEIVYRSAEEIIKLEEHYNVKEFQETK